MALVVWLVLTSGLGIYLRSFSHLNRTYGTLAAAVALLLWLYWTAFAILVGAQFNAEAMRLEEALTQPPPAQERPAAA
jgi:membrane protein